MSEDNFVRCPLIEAEIEDIECIEVADVAEQLLKEEVIPEKFRKKENWKKICKGCRWHNF